MTPSIARTSIACGLALFGVVASLGVGRSRAAPASSSTIEMWGIARTDRVRIDGTAVTVHGGGAFAGDPMAPSPPVRWPVADGAHVVEIERGTCAVQRFHVDVHGALPTTVVVAVAAESRCAIAAPTPRHLP
jgi:hypothetical protein